MTVLRGGASLVVMSTVAGLLLTTISITSALVMATREQLMAEHARVIATGHAYQCATFGARLVQDGVAVGDIPSQLFSPHGPVCRVIAVSTSTGSVAVAVRGWHHTASVELLVQFEEVPHGGFTVRVLPASGH